MARRTFTLAGAALALTICAWSAAAEPQPTVPVTLETFVRAETDRVFQGAVARGQLGRFSHYRAPLPPEARNVLRPNRDTLYSTAVFDLDAAPVEVRLPDAKGRYVSLQAISEDHETVAILHRAGRHVFTRRQVGSRYLLLGLRVLADPRDPADLARAHRIQDGVEVQQRLVGTFDIPTWDPAALLRLRNALAPMITDLSPDTPLFGARGEVDPVARLIAAAGAWGGVPKSEALYESVAPPNNDESQIHVLRLDEVPVDGFWSVTVYDRDGYLAQNPTGAHSVNSLTAQRSADGSTTIQFGGCDQGPVANCLPITPGWTYMTRLYLPRPEALAGRWKFPLARAASRDEHLR